MRSIVFQMKYLLVLAALFIVSIIGVKPVSAQNQALVDSLLGCIEKASEDTVRVNLLCDLAVHFEDNDLEKAFEYSRKALKLSEKIDYPYGKAYSTYLIGRSFTWGGDSDSSLIYIGFARELAKEIGDFELQAMCSNADGMTYYNMGEFDKALSAYLNAEKGFQKSENMDSRAAVLNNIANIYISEQMYDKAIEFHLKSLEIAEEIDAKYRIASSNYNLGLIYRDTERFDTALNYFMNAYHISKEINIQYGIGHSTMSIGSIYERKKDFDKALTFYSEAMEVKENMGDVYGTALVSSLISRCYIQKEQFSKALPYAEKSLEIVNRNSLRGIKVNALWVMALCNHGLKNDGPAFDYMSDYAKLMDSIYNETKSEQITEMQTKFETEKKELMIENLEKDNKLKEEENKKQLIIIYASVLGLLIITVFSVFLFRLFVQKRKANRILEQQNIEINQKNEEISAQRDEIAAQRDLVTEQKEHIEDQKREIEDSIRYAKRIQNAVLPSQKYVSSILENHFIIFRPKDVVSGDFYWTMKINDTLIFCASDCTGHGVPGAFMSMLGLSFLNEIVRKKEITKASEVLDNLRISIIEALKQNAEVSESGMKDGMDISIAAIDRNSLKCQWAGANNPLYIISSGVLAEIKGDKMPVAIYDRMDPFTNHELQLSKGDKVYLFTDGYADQFGGENGKKLKYKAFKNLLVDSSSFPMDEQGRFLEKYFDDWRIQKDTEFEQIDDVTVLGIEL